MLFTFTLIYETISLTRKWLSSLIPFDTLVVRAPNFLRGSAWQGQGTGKGHFQSETKRGNFHGLSSATCAKQQVGYTVKSGIIRDLVTTMITLADKSTNTKPLVQTPIAKAFSVAIDNDGNA